MLLLSFASQTSHVWQFDGVMQAKMRSLLRLLVKSIIGHRERQADATTAREAHHSASPATDRSVQNTQDTGTHTHAHSYMHTNCELQGIVNLYQETEFSISARKSIAESLVMS